VRVWDLRAPGCQREYGSRAAVNSVCLHPNQGELISGDQTGHIRVWDLTANACSCELVPEVGTAGAFLCVLRFFVLCFVWRRARADGAILGFLSWVRSLRRPTGALSLSPALTLTANATSSKYQRKNPLARTKPKPKPKPKTKNQTHKTKTKTTTVRSLTVAPDGSMMVAANNSGTCYVWRMLRGAAQSGATHFEPLHKLRAHHGESLRVGRFAGLADRDRRERPRPPPLPTLSSSGHDAETPTRQLRTTTHNPQPTTHNPQPTTHNPQPTTHNPKPQTHHQPTNQNQCQQTNNQCQKATSPAASSRPTCSSWPPPAATARSSCGTWTGLAWSARSWGTRGGCGTACSASVSCRLWRRAGFGDWGGRLTRGRGRER